MEKLVIQYKQILSNYISSREEHNLYIGQNYIRQLIQKNVTPEDVINIHRKAVEAIYTDLPDSLPHAYDFLTEIMVQFGLKFKEHQSLIVHQEELKVEMDIAVNIHNILLKTNIPTLDNLDIGMISKPIRRMNGDFVYFLFDEQNYLSVAVADIVGKGVPAALCMSMVKNGLETLEYTKHNPSYILEVLNRIIEKSVDDSMFVSSFYGQYDIRNSVLTYSSAGHEPAIHYSSKTGSFYDLKSKGLLLGVMPEVKYPQFTIELEENDFIMIVTDGVTELKRYEVSESRNLLKKIAFSRRHLSAQKMCEEIYLELQRLQDYNLDDDFTIVILKK